MATPDWKKHVREHLPPLNLSGAREQEIIEELAQQLEAACAEAIARGASQVAPRLPPESKYPTGAHWPVKFATQNGPPPRRLLPAYLNIGITNRTK
jgi:hypothetical protein